MGHSQLCYKKLIFLMHVYSCGNMIYFINNVSNLMTKSTFQGKCYNLCIVDVFQNQNFYLMTIESDNYNSNISSPNITPLPKTKVNGKAETKRRKNDRPRILE